MAGSTGSRLEMTGEQEALWSRVQEVWRAAMKRDGDTVRGALHPRFSAWERGSPIPHDREFGIASITQHELDVTHHVLHALGIEVFDGVVGVVHYGFRALLRDAGGESRGVAGRWTETWLRKGDAWLMIAAHGGGSGDAG